MSHVRVISAVVAVTAASSLAQAGIVNPLVPSWRGQSNTMFMGWETFSVAYAGANAADMPGSSTLANLFNFGPGAILTAAPMPTGIYNATGPLSIMILGGVTSAPRNPTEVVMNLASAGTGISNSSVALTLFDNAGNSRRITPTLTSTRSSVPDGFGGTAITTAFSWTVDPLAWNCTRWQIDFSSMAPHAILDAVTLDLKLVPTPGALAVLAAFVGGTPRGRRRRDER
jgi:hypothetical protein